MKRSSLVISALAIAAAMAAHSALAFESVTNDSFDKTLSTKLSDPDDVVQNLSQQYTGNSATIFHSGNVTIGIVGPNRSYSNPDSPFAGTGSGAYVPSQRQW